MGAEMTWREAAAVKIPESWVGCPYVNMTLDEVAESAGGLLWLDNKLEMLAPWQREHKAIKVYLAKEVIVQELERLLEEKRITQYGYLDEKWAEDAPW